MTIERMIDRVDDLILSNEAHYKEVNEVLHYIRVELEKLKNNAVTVKKEEDSLLDLPPMGGFHD